MTGYSKSSGVSPATEDIRSRVLTPSAGLWWTAARGLGAQRASVLGLVVRQGMTLALVGLAVGMAASYALTRLLGDLLFGVESTDPVTFGISIPLA